MKKIVKEVNILIVGVGGQGVISMSELLGQAVVDSGLNVRGSEVLGMAVRGGSVVSTIRIGSEVYGPLIPRGKGDIIVGMEPAEALRNIAYLSKTGMVIINTEAIIPPRALNQVTKLMSGGIQLQKTQFGQSHVLFSLGDEDHAGSIQIFSRLIEGPFVDYEQVIPQNNGKRLRVSNSHLLPAVRRVSILASAQTHQLRLGIKKNQLELSATSQEIGGEAHEALSVDYDADEMTIGYNSGYLQDVLRRINCDEILFELDSAVAAGIIRPGEQREGEDYLCLLMPLRLND